MVRPRRPTLTKRIPPGHFGRCFVVGMWKTTFGCGTLALSTALPDRYIGRVSAPFLLRTVNGLIFASCSCAALAHGHGLRQEFITPHSPAQNGLVERVIRTLIEQRVHRHRFETLQYVVRVISNWIGFYNHRRLPRSSNMKTPAYSFALAA